MVEYTLQTSFPIDESKILSSEVLKSSELLLMVNHTDLHSIVQEWLDKQVDLHLAAAIGTDEVETLRVYYYFMNRATNAKIVLGVDVDRENPVMNTLSDLTGSRVYEGEITEMLGIHFKGNELSQVFLPDSWDAGYPLRKDWVDPRGEE